MLLLDVVQWGCSLPVACLTVLVGVGDGRLLVGGGATTLVGVWSSITGLLEVVDGRLMVAGAVAASVGVRSPVVSTVLMLLVVLSPVEVYNIHMEQYVYKVYYS